MIQTNNSALDRTVFLFVIADILFLPFLLPVPVPLSFAAVPIWALCLSRSPQPALFMLALVGIASAAISFIFSYEARLGFSGIGLERLANTAIVVFMFASYVCARSTYVDNIAVFCRLFRAYLIFVFCLALLFFVDTAAYFSVRTFWSFEDSTEVFESLTVLTRFTGIMSDPNNLAVSTCAVSAFLVFFQPWLIRKNMAAMAMTAIIVIASMSATGAICYAILLAGYIIGSGRSLGARVAIIFGSAALVAAVYLLVRDTNVFMLASERVMESDADSRYTRWALAMDASEFLSSLVIGDGGTIDLNGLYYRPHNGHIHLAYSFGLICYAAFAAIFFRVRKIADWRSWLFLAILLIGFTVNVGIYEHRFAGIWMMLMALYYEVAIPIKPVAVRQSRAVPALQTRRAASVAGHRHGTL